MRLRSGVTVEQAISQLDQIMQESAFCRAPGMQEAPIKLNGYLNWINGAQQRLRNIFADTELEDSLLTRAYWHLAMATVPHPGSWGA